MLVSIYSLNCLHMWIKLFRSIFLLKFGYLLDCHMRINWNSVVKLNCWSWELGLLVKIEFLFFCAIFGNLIDRVITEHLKFYLLFSLKSWHKRMRFWVTQRSVKYMINTARMRLKREWVVVVVPMTHSTYSNPSSVAAHLVVSFPPPTSFRFIVL